MKRVLVLQHAPCEKPGLIERALDRRGYAVTPVNTFAGDAPPEHLGEADGLVIMGGPMGVYEFDRYPFLRAELRLIENVLREEKPVLGVCLGSQLLAAALGAEVRKGKRKEIGWHTVTLSGDAETDALLSGAGRVFTACHWHGDVFDLPADSRQLASSSLTPVQAFRYGANAYGFLFHMEVTLEILRGMTTVFAGELNEAKLDGAGILRESELYLPPLKAVGTQVFDRWAALLGSSGL